MFAEKALARLVVAEAQAGLRQHAARDAERDHLAVDQHAVAVEDDDLRPARRLHRLAGLALGPFEDRKRAALAGVKARRSRRPQARLSAQRRHRPHGGEQCLLSGRDGADHRRTEQHRFRGLRRRHRLAAGVGDDLADEGALRRAAADDDGLEVVSRALERLDDVGDPIGEAAEAGDIELLEARRVLAEIESDDRRRARRRRRPGARRPMNDGST